MKKSAASQHGDLNDWIETYQPVWATGLWLERRRFDRDTDRLSRLGILPSYLWNLKINESTSELEITPHNFNEDEHIGLIAVKSKFFHSYSTADEPPKTKFIGGTANPCPKCDKSGFNRNGGECPKCSGEGFTFDLKPEIAQISNRTEDLNGAFLGANRFQSEIAKFREWEERYKPIFWTLDGDIENAIELLDELGVDEGHLWTSYYEFREHSVANLLVEYIDYEDIEDSSGSISLYVTEKPRDEWFPSIGIDCSDGYSCLACSGRDEDCEICDGEEPAYVEFQSASFSSDLDILRKTFG